MPRTHRHCRGAALMFFALFLSLPAGAADSGSDGREALGPGDTVRITVFQRPELTTETRISARGTLMFPLIGEIAVADRTPMQAGARIAERLREGRFVNEPQVSVNLVEVRSRQVSVLGHVGRPGNYALDGVSLTLSEALAQAGGINQEGADTVIVMTQRNGYAEKLEIDVPGMYLSGDLSSDVELESGDMVFVPGAPVFYVYGAVQRPGEYRLEPQTIVLSAIALGGGLSPRGTERGLKIHRRMPDGTVQVLDSELSDAVQPNDVIMVKESIF